MFMQRFNLNMICHDYAVCYHILWLLFMHKTLRFWLLFTRWRPLHNAIKTLFDHTHYLRLSCVDMSVRRANRPSWIKLKNVESKKDDLPFITQWLSWLKYFMNYIKRSCLWIEKKLGDQIMYFVLDPKSVF